MSSIKSHNVWHIQNLLEVDEDAQVVELYVAQRLENERDIAREKILKLEEALCSISNMCIGKLTMSYSLDAEAIGQLIFEATSKSNPELNSQGGKS